MSKAIMRDKGVNNDRLCLFDTSLIKGGNYV